MSPCPACVKHCPLCPNTLQEEGKPFSPVDIVFPALERFEPFVQWLMAFKSSLMLRCWPLMALLASKGIKLSTADVATMTYVNTKLIVPILSWLWLLSQHWAKVLLALVAWVVLMSAAVVGLFFCPFIKAWRLCKPFFVQEPIVS